MAVRQSNETYTMQASVALNNLTAGTGQLFKAVSAVGGIAANAKTALGLLQDGADNGGFITYAYAGISKFVAGGAIALGKGVTVTTSGYCTSAGSGDIIVGRALAAVSSGCVGTGNFNFVSPVFIGDSLGLY